MDAGFHLFDLRLVAGVGREVNQHPLALDLDTLDEADGDNVALEAGVTNGPQQAPRPFRFITFRCRNHAIHASSPFLSSCIAAHVSCIAACAAVKSGSIPT